MALTDAQFKVQQKRIERMVKKWQAPLWLGDWRLHLSFFRDGIPDEGPREGSEDGRSPRAVCRSDWYYLQAHLKFDVDDIVELTDKELERTIVHELMHCRFAETRSISDDWWKHEERAVETMTMSLLHCIREATAGRLKLAGAATK